MAENKGILKNILIGVVIIGGFFAGYTLFFKNDSVSEPLLLVEEGVSSTAPESAVELLRILGDLRKINLDVSLLGEETYRALRDFSVLLVPEPKGRPNPFAPLQ